MANGGRSSDGLIDSIRALAATLVAIAKTRLELLSTELEEERGRLTTVLVLVLAGMLSFSLAGVLATLFVVVAFWDTHRLLVIGLLAGFFVAVGGVCWIVMYRLLKQKPKLFTASLAELAKDERSLTPRQ
jgi:uncharacterized membrane protein YqjE